MTGEWLSGPLRMSMILAAEGKHAEAAAMFDRYSRELRERPLRVRDDPCADCQCRCLEP